MDLVIEKTWPLVGFPNARSWTIKPSVIRPGCAVSRIPTTAVPAFLDFGNIYETSSDVGGPGRLERIL